MHRFSVLPIELIKWRLYSELILVAIPMKRYLQRRNLINRSYSHGIKMKFISNRWNEGFDAGRQVQAFALLGQDCLNSASHFFETFFHPSILLDIETVREQESGRRNRDHAAELWKSVLTPSASNGGLQTGEDGPGTWAIPFPPVGTFFIGVRQDEEMASQFQMQYVALLDELCVRYGYCLSTRNRDLILADPPADPSAFIDAVLVAEGLNPEYVDGRTRSTLENVARKFFLAE